MNETTDNGPDRGYRVLARKYRPQTFADLIGQGAMVRVLEAAFATGRIAHAYMLTGVRGVGKTTTARLLARGLNYETADGQAQPTIHMADDGLHGAAIAESRHLDVLEMDAASRTGIDDIREIIEGAKFKPAAAPYKVYIIDEVHMLSKAAFNGLLKILEEPPPHVKFIFATTEVRRVPVTVLSRCQRFDLRRVEPQVMIDHLRGITEKEGVRISDGALSLLARASDGSVRDALSLLDQAIAAAASDNEEIAEDSLRAMLGLADRERLFDLYEHLITGKAKDALSELRAQYDLGADPLEVLRDLLELTHWLTRLKVAGDPSSDAQFAGAQLKRSQELAAGIGMPVLHRFWQGLLKGLQEAQSAPRPIDAAEMVLVRLAFMSDLPSPEDLVRKLSGRPPEISRETTGETGGAPSSQPSSPSSGPADMGSQSGQQGRGGPAPRMAAQPEINVSDPIETPVAAYAPLPQSFEELLALVSTQREIRLRTELEDFVHLVSFEPGRIEFRPAAGAPKDLASRLSESLSEWTGERWVVTLSNDEGGETLKSIRNRLATKREEEIRGHPLVQAALKAFPEARIVEIRETSGATDSIPDEHHNQLEGKMETEQE